MLYKPAIYIISWLLFINNINLQIMNVCSYTKVKNYDEKGINDRLSTLFKQVCYLSSKVTKGVYADNAAALSGGLKVGDVYNDASGNLKVVV